MNGGPEIMYGIRSAHEGSLPEVRNLRAFPTSSMNYIYGFGGIAILILLIACINYINLATARAVDRAKEVSIRKVVGAGRKQLFLQFIGESFIVSGIAFLLAFFIAASTLPLLIP